MGEAEIDPAALLLVPIHLVLQFFSHLEG